MVTQESEPWSRHTRTGHRTRTLRFKNIASGAATAAPTLPSNMQLDLPTKVVNTVMQHIIDPRATTAQRQASGPRQMAAPDFSSNVVIAVATLRSREIGGLCRLI